MTESDSRPTPAELQKLIDSHVNDGSIRLNPTVEDAIPAPTTREDQEANLREAVSEAFTEEVKLHPKLKLLLGTIKN